ncbi:MAG: hypothetical protein GXO66_02505 [Euryarchaeota archaeon]|nr:hypothetical protein [Euryarchaeota archaeon]
MRRSVKPKIFLFAVIALLLLLAGCTGEEAGDGVKEQHALQRAPQGDITFALEVDLELLVEEGGINRSWFDGATSRGVGAISFEVLSREGTAVYDSPAIREAGFALDPELGNALPALLGEAAERNIKVVVMLETVGHVVGDMKSYSGDIRASRMTPEWVSTLIAELAAEARRQGAELAFDEEALDEEYITAIREATRREGVEYAHFFEDLKCRADLFISEDYAYYPYSASGEDLEYMRKIFRDGSYYGKLGFLNIMFGSARACNKPSGVATAGGWGLGARTHQNIALMRAVQFSPEFYMFTVGEDDTGRALPGEEEYVEGYNFSSELLLLIEEFGRKGSDKPKPLANLILDKPPRESELYGYYTDALLSSADAITNAILAAGYELLVTAEPLAGAELYYVFTPGEVFGEGGDISGELASLAEGDKPVFYQVVGGIPQDENWAFVMERAGMPGAEPIFNDDARRSFEPIPEEVTHTFPAGEYRVKYAGYSFEVFEAEQLGRFTLGHHLNHLPPEEVEGEVLLAGTISKDGGRTALIVRRGNVFFVNGGYLHLEASSLLANIMAELRGKPPAYNAPSYGYFTNGESRAVFFAPYAVEVDLNVYGGSRVTEFDEAGRRVEPGVRLEEGRLRGRVGRFHLVVVD